MRTKHKDNQLPGRVNIPKSARPVREIPDILKVYIGIDNGVTGSIGITNGIWSDFMLTPTFSEQDYTKAQKNITRVNHIILRNFLQKIKANSPFILVLMERPMTGRSFNSVASAMRAWESTLTVIEELELPKRFIDSKEWQKDMLPKGIKGSDKLKIASKQIGCREFPQFKDKYKGDADGILIAEWARRKQL